MTANEWKEDFKSFVDELQMPRDDYKGIMAYIDECPVKDTNGWISVKDKIPDGECLAFSSKYKEMIIGYLYEDKSSASNCSAENDEVVLYDVTHWMPLPEWPKDGDVECG